ncbi:Dabb family protein [Emticicia sp. 21SJ11W-3]|uniref:Dabb family protein n=1 Tax=Emticicia sp. 21SJ11W-3 TaxID=2916755 RepID=UPI0020A02E17|nr:Dabb family protein [Emticicia sp. 21SJ11W-3]UTA69935.1 Dabb family protein [Emticicia sp. 21SJ11W-3]
MANLKKGFVHTVFFWLKDKTNEADHKELHAGLLELSKIDLIQTAYVGLPADTNRAVIDSSYQFSITFVFDTPEQQAAYQTDPDHLAFVEKCSHLWEKVVVYDAES